MNKAFPGIMLLVLAATPAGAQDWRAQLRRSFPRSGTSRRDVVPSLHVRAMRRPLGSRSTA
jgi:hypothetical protein